MSTNLSLPRTVKLKAPPMVGDDIDAHGRAMHIYLQDGQLYAHTKQRDIVRRTFGTGKRTLAKKCAKKAGLPQYGVIGPALYAAMREANAYDRKSDALIASCNKPPKPKLVEPNQGFDSLHISLWEVYSLGRHMGLTDLGTHNPASRLPSSGRPSDHAVYPAFAFDLGIEPDTGWNNLKARAYVQRIVGRPEVEYVILGDRIWTRRGFGTYRSGGHLNHVHVSGNR